MRYAKFTKIFTTYSGIKRRWCEHVSNSSVTKVTVDVCFRSIPPAQALKVYWNKSAKQCEWEFWTIWKVVS